MSEPSTSTEIDIRLRARSQDGEIIDRAAELVGVDRSQFMLASALKEARNVLLDQTTLQLDIDAFRKVVDWMDAPATPSEAADMTRLLHARMPAKPPG